MRGVDGDISRSGVVRAFYGGLMSMKPLTSVSAVALLVLAGCASDDAQPGDASTAVETTSDSGPPGPGPGGTVPVSDAALDDFAAWYEDEAAAAGIDLDERFTDGDETERRDAYSDFVERLCGVQAGSPDRMRASATSIKDDPQFGGDEDLAASAIDMARMACGLDG